MDWVVEYGCQSQEQGAVSCQIERPEEGKAHQLSSCTVSAPNSFDFDDMLLEPYLL